MRMPGDSPETIGHAEIEIGTGLVMLADEFPDHGFLSPLTIGGTPVTVHVYVEDADAVFAKAVEHGARITREMENQFYGDRLGQFVDPWGHQWSVASHVEDVSEEEMGRRMAEMGPG
jgi:PhnB protein